MAAILTILIPNYNRPAALGRLLSSVFGAIQLAGATDRINVAVVDDFSTEDPTTVIRPYMGLANFTFRAQSEKCGNAELAFLNALEWVDTEYVWLLGNDDQILRDGIKTVLHLLDRDDKLGFILLNPLITREKTGQQSVPISSTSAIVRYTKTEDLFMDFGFCTSTTTFPCLIMKARLVRNFHDRHRLTQFATVYSHSFTIFGALRSQPGLFLANPVVSFNHNEQDEEQRKLWRQSPHGIMFYHHTLGLARLIRECARVTGVPISQLGIAVEDEVNKNDLTVHSTFLSHFLLMFFVEQLVREQLNVINPQIGFGHLTRAEIHEVNEVVKQFGDQSLSNLCANALEVFHWPSASPTWKHDFLRRVQDDIRHLIKEKQRAETRSIAVVGPRKVAVSSHSLSSLRGDGDRNFDIATHKLTCGPSPEIN